MKTIFTHANAAPAPPAGSSHTLWAKFLILFLTLSCFLTTKAGTIDLLNTTADGCDVEGASYNTSTHEATFSGDWKVVGWNLSGTYVSATVSFSSNCPRGVIKCDYEGGSNSETEFNNETSKTLSLNGKITKIYIQLANSGSVILTEMYITTAEPDAYTKIIKCADFLDYAKDDGNKPSGTKDNYPGSMQLNNNYYGTVLGGNFLDTQASQGEIWIPITLPAGTYTFISRYANSGGETWFNLYNTDGSKIEGSKHLRQIGGSGWDIDYSSEYHNLDAGNYTIGFYSNNNYTALDIILVKATTPVFSGHTITMEKTTGSDEDPTSSVSNAMEGATVSVTAGPAISGYYFSGWTADPSVTFTVTSELSAYFTMPDADVTITANYGAVVNSTFSYGVNGDGEITSCENGESEPVASGTSVTSGTSLTLTAAAHTNYIFTGWSATGVDITGHVTDNPIIISMPANDATLTANFATITKIINDGTKTGSALDWSTSGTMSETIVNADSILGVFNHSVIKITYSGLDSDDKYCGRNIGKKGSYVADAHATDFCFYYKTETSSDKVAFCFDIDGGSTQYKMELAATNNSWKYVHITSSSAANWNNNIRIYINKKDGSNITANASGNIYISEIAATTVTSRPDIDVYTYTRTVTSGNYGTLCLPMAGTIENATLYTIAGKETTDGTDYIVLEDQGTAITAGTPYIFQSSAATITATMPAAPERDHVDGALVGSYVEEEILDNTGNYYFLRNNQFYQVHADDHVSVRAYGAYIDMSAIGAYTPAPGKRYVRMAVSSETDQAQGLTEQQAQPAVTKVLENGVIYILRDGRRYTILGQ